MFPSQMYKNPLSNVDAAWFGMEKPDNLMMVSGVLVFDEILDFDRLKATIEYRLLPIKRFRQRVIQPKFLPLKPFWEDDTEFQLDTHVKQIQLTHPNNIDEFFETLNSLISTPLDYDRPLWQFHLIENFQGGSVFIGRLHHCIADGMALLHVLLSLADDGPDSPWPTRINSLDSKSEKILNSPIRGFSSLGKKTKKFGEWLFDESMAFLSKPDRFIDLAKLGTQSAKSAVATAAYLLLRTSDPNTIFKGKLGIQKKAAWSSPIALDKVKNIGKILGGTVNDVLLSAMAGAFRAYMMEKKCNVTEDLRFRAAVPVNLRKPSDSHKLGNQFGLVFLSLPVGIADPYDRFLELKKSMDELKGTPEAIVAFGVLHTIGLSPGEVQSLVVEIFGTKATTVMTNVPGPRKTVYFCGAPIRNIMFWVPQAGRLGVGISIISYDGQVRLGAMTDAGLVPDPENITAAFEAEFTKLSEFANLVQAYNDEAKDEHVD